MLIRKGIGYDDNLFERESLTSVKNFYNKITQNQDLKTQLKEIGIRERLIRCASQYAYFAIRNTKHIALLCSSIAEVLSEISTWLDYPAKYWHYWDFSKKQSKFRDDLSTSLIEKIKLKHQIRCPQKNDIISYTMIQNYFRHLKRQLFHHLNRKTLAVQISLENRKDILIRHYNGEYINRLIGKFCTNISTILTRCFRRNRKEAINSNLKNINDEKSLSQIIYNICGTKKIESIDLEEWQLKKQLWMMHYKEELENLVSEKQISNCVEKTTNQLKSIKREDLLKEFFYPKRFRFFQEILGNPRKDFTNFLERVIRYHATRHIIEDLLKHFLPEVREFLLKFIEKPLDFLKVPHFSKASIPLGPDDNQVYKLEEFQESVEIVFSFYPNMHQRFVLVDPERYYELRKEGATPLRGVLMASGGKYQLAIPFSKRLPKMPEKKPVEKQNILNCDLGLKTLATLSVTHNGIERCRKFLDQRQLNTPKDKWFLPYNKQKQTCSDQHFKSVNYKLNLTQKRKKINLLQRELSDIKEKNKKQNNKKTRYPKYNKHVDFWYKRRELKSCIRKMQNIHKELVHQLSTRIVEYAKFNKVDTIRFEDLRWTKHASKSDTSFFISTWQVHWFFSRIIQLTASIGRRYEIRTEIVNPYKSSKICSTCGKEGQRQGKKFKCINELCKIQLDSDLNAARNIGNINRKSYPVQL